MQFHRHFGSILDSTKREIKPGRKSITLCSTHTALDFFLSHDLPFSSSKSFRHVHVSHLCTRNPNMKIGAGRHTSLAYLLWLLAKDNKETHIPYVSESFLSSFFLSFSMCIVYHLTLMMPSIYSIQKWVFKEAVHSTNFRHWSLDK